jgi:hypothetical protein
VKGLLAALIFFALAPAAQAASFTVSTSTTQAGAPADLSIDAGFDTTPHRVVLHLPPGLVGNPSAVPRCPVQTFETGSCPETTRVGDASARSGLVPASGGVYNLAPNASEPARLGVRVDGLLVIPIRNQAAVSLRPDGGLDSTIASLNTGGLSLDALGLKLFRSFMTLPTSCAPATVTIDADTTRSSSFTPTGCDRVPFTPAVSAALETTRRVVPSGATVALTLPAGQAHVRRAEMVLPVGTTLSPGVASGLEACTEQQFGGAGCPAASQVGTVSFVTPLLGTLGGEVYFGLGAPYRLYIVVAGGGVLVKLAGDVRLDPATGQITTVFDGLPQVPFTSFALSFQGGAHAVLANPATCGAKTLTAVLTPWSGTAAKTATASFTIDADGRGGACTAASFAPAVRVAAASTAAGRPAGAVTLEVMRPDGAQDLARVTTELPPGLAGSLTGIPACTDAQADAGACPASTRVGSVSAQAGSGDAPVALSGTVSLTGPTGGGLAGLAIAIPGRVGPVDLGTVVVRASIALRPDGGLTVRTTPLPRLIGGVPVSIRSLALTLDWPGFMLNASSCAPLQVKAVLDGADGATATVTAPYQATDCAGLRFAPRLEATVGARGSTGAGAHPPLRTVITVPAGQSSTASAKVDLPTAIGIDLKQLAKACAPQLYAAGACPASSVIGSGTAATPLLPAALSGPVSLAVANAGELPGLALSLRGAVTLPLFGTVLPGPDGVTHTAFSGIPDVPLSRFELAFTGGGSSPLNLTRDICHGPRPNVRAQFSAHSGAQATVTAPLKVSGCPPVASLTRRGHTLTLRISSGRDAAAVERATVTPPAGLGLGRRTLKRSATLHVRRLPGKRAFRVAVRDASAQWWTLRLRATAPR